MKRFHEPGDEKQPVVIAPPTHHGDFLTKTHQTARTKLQHPFCDNRPPRKRNTNRHEPSRNRHANDAATRLIDALFP
ncbi:hypothetical protein [Paraburkholderia diazotrophica]|uniref:hypothetical protein n=1 Tax=Paraburkholderia diazotrophica TaxID=667676 RepID=UPI00317EBF05